METKNKGHMVKKWMRKCGFIYVIFIDPVGIVCGFMSAFGYYKENGCSL